MSSDMKTDSTGSVFAAILALALLAVVFTAGFVAYKCNVDYDTIVKIVK